MTEPRLTIKELADALRRSRTYVHAMKAKGFIMPGNRATLRRAEAWLARNPPPRSRFCAWAAEQNGT